MSVLVDLLFKLIELERALNILDSVNLEFYCTTCFVMIHDTGSRICGAVRVLWCVHLWFPNNILHACKSGTWRQSLIWGSPSLLGPFRDSSSLPTYLNNWINFQHQTFSRNSIDTSAVCCGDVLSQSCHCRVFAQLRLRIFASMFLIRLSLVSR